MAKILEGKFFSNLMKDESKKKIEELKSHGIEPALAVILVGEDPASQVYVRNKHLACEELGIKSIEIKLPTETSKEELLAKIDQLNSDSNVHGILVQLPLPKAIKSHEEEILNRIDPLKDVDGFHPMNVGNLVIGKPTLIPCTPAGCIKMLELAGIEIDGARAVIIGRSNIVGKPMFHLLMARHATVTICHSHTQNLADITRQADILVAAMGKPRFVTADMVKPSATIIDVGINRVERSADEIEKLKSEGKNPKPTKLVGDVDFENVEKIAGAITPVPGGVGLLTVAMLMQNVVRACELQIENRI
ncbi:MAG: bifunctional methylenetetrahydrofolate dehydrogenase/methenyltetrahydrofolate cyclohydrolase FolD [Selenomonadaceae bacterium]|nr:bifunctional methylenetetrahydrofolate dehydrogenase/methenyltetrahydrofolate cyclohydrolase FolD [Selenomonadaceae bacterium]